MRYEVTCPMCGHSPSIGPLDTQAYGGVKLRARLESFRTASFVAFICEKCGYVSLFVDDTGFENLQNHLKTTRHQ